MRYEVAVVGAGPAGLTCAAELERRGESVVVLEKEGIVGEPVQCAGLFSLDGLKRLAIEKGDYVLNEVRGARVFSASGAMAEIKASGSKACVVDRGEFDRFLAEGYGGELMLGRGVCDARKKGDGYELGFGDGAVGAERVVLATGTDYRLHGKLGFKPPANFISAVQYEMKGFEADEELVELYVGSVAPGFFAWVIPMGGGAARVGLGVLDAEEGAQQYMENFLKRLERERRFKERRVLRKSGGLIPLFDPHLEICKGGAYLVGDAAGQVKATTGGGVMMGGLAAKALARAMQERTDYPREMAGVSKELSNHLMLRNVMNRFKDEQYEHMVEFLKRPAVKRAVEEHGDMDLTEPLVKAVMSDPALLMQALKSFGGGLLF